MEPLMHRLAYLAALGACAGAMLTSPQAQAETRGVLELFTSQGCSSCPPADKLLGELSRDPSLVVFSLNVDYWDSLGWKDTLADPRNSERQRAYSRVRGDRGVYTPQLVINGTAHVVGSDKAAVQRALASAREGLSVPVRAAVKDGKLSVDLPAGTGAGEVWVYGLAKEVPVAVARGENRGRTVTYHNVARRWQKLGDWNGKAASWTLPVSDLAGGGVDLAAVVVQSGGAANPGAMLGAAVASLR
jgi:hypothetical protein